MALYLLQKKFKKNGHTYKNLGGLVEQGNEIFTKYPIEIATNEFYYKNYSNDADRTNFATIDHARAIQIIELKINNKKLQIINVHGIYTKEKIGDKRTIAQCTFILKTANRNNLPTIIVGDFNLLPFTKSIAILNKKFRNLITEYKIKSTRPDFKDNLDTGDNTIDYVFVNSKIRVKKFQVLETDVSDHLPLILDFDII